MVLLLFPALLLAGCDDHDNSGTTSDASAPQALAEQRDAVDDNSGTTSDASAPQALAEQRDAVVRSCELLCDTEGACGLEELSECLRDCSREEGTIVAASGDTPADRACLSAMHDYIACLSGAECRALAEGDPCAVDEEREEQACRGLQWWRD